MLKCQIFLVCFDQLDAVHFPGCPLGVSAAPLKSKRILQSTTWPHQSTEMALARATSHIKVVRPPCFQLLPRKNVIRSTSLREWHHLVILQLLCISWYPSHLGLCIY